MLPYHPDEKVMIDPPLGWQYGFPKEWTGDTKEMLKDSGYPAKDIDWAALHCRFWTETIDK